MSCTVYKCRWCGAELFCRCPGPHDVRWYDCTSTGCMLNRRGPRLDGVTPAMDEPGALRVRLRDHQTSSGSGNNYTVALVTAERAECAAFARMALAVKLRELDAVCIERDRLIAKVDELTKECREIAVNCQQRDADLEWAIDGKPVPRRRA